MTKAGFSRLKRPQRHTVNFKIIHMYIGRLEALLIRKTNICKMREVRSEGQSSRNNMG